MEPEKDVLTDKEKRLAAFSYLFGFISGFIILVSEKNSRFVRFHALQSTITFFTLFITTVILEVIPGYGPFLGALVFFASAAYGLTLIRDAIQGKYCKVPHIGNIVEKEV